MANYITHEDDARIPEGIRVRTLKNGSVSYKRWMLPITFGHLTLREGYEFLDIVAAPQGKIPEIIRWTEGKDSHLVKEFFYGGVELKAHDYIHLLLGRGLLPKDEAFVIGFTMGSTNRLATMNKEVFSYIAQHYYPNAYQMDDESRIIYMDAAMLGYLSDCQPLDQIDFAPYMDRPIADIREQIGLFPNLIKAYYRDIEHRRHPEDKASSRLISEQTDHNLWRFSNPIRNETELDLEECAREAKNELSKTDQAYEFNDKEFTDTLNSARDEVEKILDDQKEIARKCFEEIKKICGENEESVQRDDNQQMWLHFFNEATSSVLRSYEKVKCDIERNLWETESDTIGRRAYVHALLNRSDSTRDRAFCRGFYDGSSNKKSTYAADMKAEALGRVLMTLDGFYTPDMKQSYQDGVRLGYVSDCKPLDSVDFGTLSSCSMEKARSEINLTVSILEAYHEEIEELRPPK